MYNKIIISLFISFFCVVFNVTAQDILVSGIPAGPFCGGDTFTVNYDYQHTQALGSTNRFSVVLSNINGSFSSGTVSIAITATTQNPIGSLLATIPYNFTKSSKYRIKVVSSSPAKESAESDSITINENPGANFTTNLATQCFKKHNYVFNNTSTGSGTLTYLWLFSDGDTSTAKNPSKKFSVYGSYTATLTTSGVNYLCKSTKVSSLTLRHSPIAGFAINKSSICRYDTAIFTNTSSTPSGSMSYSWNFGDGSNLSTIVNPSHQYSNVNNYKVTLEVANTTNSCRDTIEQFIKVESKPTANFSISTPNRCYKTNISTFNNSSSISPTSPLSYLWEFGDGDTSTKTSPVKVFTKFTNFSVKLTAATQGGCKGSAVNSVTLYKEPVAAFTINDSTQCLPGNNFTFTNTSTSSSAGTLSYNWLIGTTTSTAGTPPAFTTTTPGFFTSRLIATTSLGTCRDTVYHEFIVYPTPAPVAITGPTACIGQQTANYSVSGSSINTYNWAVSGGTIQGGQGSQQISVKWFENNGITGRVSVIEVSPYGCTSTAFMIAVNLSPSRVGEIKNPHNIVVYPNPASDKLNINTNYYTGKYKLTMYNNLGQIVHAHTYLGGEQQLDISQLNPGIYLYTIQGDNFSFTEKLIKIGNE